MEGLGLVTSRAVAALRGRALVGKGEVWHRPRRERAVSQVFACQGVQEWALAGTLAVPRFGVLGPPGPGKGRTGTLNSTLQRRHTVLAPLKIIAPTRTAVWKRLSASMSPRLGHRPRPGLRFQLQFPSLATKSEGGKAWLRPEEMKSCPPALAR